MDTMLVLLIVGAAVGYLVRRGVKIVRARNGDACQCGCSGCGQAAACGSEAKWIQSERDAVFGFSLGNTAPSDPHEGHEDRKGQQG